jgi:hypothetical protein
MEGRKDDTGKARFDLLPVKPLFKVAEVYTIGAKKYDDRNWEKGIKWGRIFAAMLRHAWNWWCGEKLDPEDGQHHLASVAWCALTLMEFEETHPELDDRPVQKGGGSFEVEDMETFNPHHHISREAVEFREKGDENAEIQTS